MMSTPEIIYHGAAGIALIAFGYILVRALSIAYYRTRSEYDRGEWKKRNGD